MSEVKLVSKVIGLLISEGSLLTKVLGELKDPKEAIPDGVELGVEVLEKFLPASILAEPVPNSVLVRSIFHTVRTVADAVEASPALHKFMDSSKTVSAMGEILDLIDDSVPPGNDISLSDLLKAVEKDSSKIASIIAGCFS